MGDVGLTVLGVALLAIGGDLLVRGSSRIAAAARMSPLLIGLTVVAFGTSAPEMAASVAAAAQGKGDIAFGNVVGSNIANILLVLGASAILAPLAITSGLLRRDVPVMVASALAVVVVAWDGAIIRFEGAALLMAALAYVLHSIRAARGARMASEPATSPTVGSRPGLGRGAAEAVIGLALLVLGARWMVEGAVALARLLGLSELIIGLTVVAVGTSLPEIAASLIAAARGQRDIAIGNVVGSNTFNVLSVLGVSSVSASGGMAIHPGALHFDVPVMVAASLACMPVFLTGARICRTEGVFMVGYYAAYVIYLVLDASGHDHLPVMSLVMGAFVVPLTLILMGFAVYRHLRNGAPPAR
ncbi:MAG: calcium/sodium antiporter [Chthonomonadales bacterium]|nr:calcium/sodium antiporter [Chthonomonadales bacterium]